MVVSNETDTEIFTEKEDEKNCQETTLEEHIHKYSSEVINEPTCTSVGKEKFFCECGSSYIKEIEKVNHKESEWKILSDATCTQKGSKTKLCTVCGVEIKKEEIGYKEHILSDWVIKENETQFSDGEMCRVCNNCGKELDTRRIVCLQVSENMVSYWDFYEEVLRLVNEIRAEAGVASLVLDENLCQAATKRSVEMDYKNHYSHYRPDGTSYLTIFEDYNINYKSVGENIAYGFESPKDVVDAWRNSEGHYKNMINESFSKLGVGYSKGCEGGYYDCIWTQLFTN